MPHATLLASYINETVGTASERASEHLVVRIFLDKLMIFIRFSPHNLHHCGGVGMVVYIEVFLSITAVY